MLIKNFLYASKQYPSRKCFKSLRQNAFFALVILVLIFIPRFSYCQQKTFEAAFDRFDLALNNGNGYKDSSNINARLVWGESYIMQGYMAMYRTTLNTFYLKKLITHAKGVIAQRDDIAGRFDYEGISTATWIVEDSNYSINARP